MTSVVPKGAHFINSGLYRPRKTRCEGALCQGMTLVVPIKPIEGYGLHRLRKNSILATVLKGHGFIRAAKGRKMCPASAAEGCFWDFTLQRLRKPNLPKRPNFDFFGKQKARL